VPAAHGVQETEPAAELVPARQREQLAAPLAAYVPAAHCEHEVAPEPDVEPPAQSWQLAAPLLALNVPGLQTVQLLEPAIETEPGMQAVHELAPALE
jgi:hypothetical protein